MKMLVNFENGQLIFKPMDGKTDPRMFKQQDQHVFYRESSNSAWIIDINYDIQVHFVNLLTAA